ncbi:hypothetical protein PAPYR_2370 [Paratrimastix pyriformis]|uniref:Uncharacterized protein n=1 Tax=Paratrimastix pyriformis TaxID=342808 RepID=A0ABQ8UQ79_9EUKA|nr:hypothetical protein PAPYR_2370 [Paratrimastix pyriformis]
MIDINFWASILGIVGSNPAVDPKVRPPSPMKFLLLIALLTATWALDCPVASFHAATFDDAFVDGDELVIKVDGYSLSEFVIASGPPPTMGDPACRPPPTITIPDPALPCDVKMETRELLSDLALCPAVIREVIDDKMYWHIPLHVLSTVLTGIDPNGDSVYGRRYQSMEILIEQTISVNASTTVDVMHIVNYTGFEKGDSYFSHIDSEYILHFSIWTNFPYEQGLPFITSAPIPLGNIELIAEPADDNCADPTRFCERAYFMRIIGQETTCLLGGVYRIGSHVTCREAEHCPSDTEGDYFADYEIIPGNCEATVINITVTGRLWVEMDGGTALAWGRHCTVMGELSADLPLANADMLRMRVCTLPHVGLTCPEASSQVLVVNNAPAFWGAIPELHEEVTRTGTMLWNVTFHLDLMAFHFALGVDMNANLITDLQFDAEFGNFVPGHVSEVSFLLRAAANGGEDAGDLVPAPKAGLSAILPITGVIDPVTPTISTAGTVAVAVGSAVGALALVVGLAVTLLLIRRKVAAKKAAPAAPSAAPGPEAKFAPSPQWVARANCVECRAFYAHFIFSLTLFCFFFFAFVFSYSLGWSGVHTGTKKAREPEVKRTLFVKTPETGFPKMTPCHLAGVFNPAPYRLGPNATPRAWAHFPHWTTSRWRRTKFVE